LEDVDEQQSIRQIGQIGKSRVVPKRHLRRSPQQAGPIAPGTGERRREASSLPSKRRAGTPAARLLITMVF
jgi:hypothetical protein